MLEISKEGIKKILPLEGPSIEEVKKYLKKYNDEYIVIKCGGSLLVEKDLFRNFINDISVLSKLGLIPILIHGGGKRISIKLNESGIKSNFINGLRITDTQSIDIVENVLSDFNKEITDALKKNNCDSEGITCKKNNILRVVQQNKNLGYVGAPTDIDNVFFKKIIKEKKVPVIAPLGLGENNQVYNINADTAAGFIAKKLKARRLIIMSDVEGVLNKDKKLISEIDTKKIDKLIDNKTIHGGMIPKIQNCLDVANNGVKGVVIIDGRKNHSILFELLSDKGSGTLIRS